MLTVELSAERKKLRSDSSRVRRMVEAAWGWERVLII
jgi:hypothetical protein